MPNLHLLLVTGPDNIALLPEPGALLIADSRPPGIASTRHTRLFSYPCNLLHGICRDLQHLMYSGPAPVAPPQPLPIAMAPGLLKTLLRLADADDETMLRLVLAYSLTLECQRTSTLLRSLLTADADLFDTLYRHRLEPWPVARYADLFGLSQRKFNQLFNDKFGMAPKRWLLHQRLGHARQLLETTSKKVIDVALESGFCNAAHFSDCFRRHFSQSPSEVRRASLHHRAG
ncbi:helix-turn-helix domain-containing protein [Edwardsiella piscicida]|uniref:helix-turn-helix domain-containing protein n=1 Tax=Edwardsiella piscicida TaxID=1263550 RepID=UPI002A65A7FA|nr:helix-turn-helix domain-containing protein [Edwardsiella piscicida]